MTAMKYHRQPRVGRPLQPGERFSVAREMENSVRWVLITERREGEISLVCLQGLQGDQPGPQSGQEERRVGGQEESLRQHGENSSSHLLQVCSGDKVTLTTTNTNTNNTIKYQHYKYYVQICQGSWWHLLLWDHRTNLNLFQFYQTFLIKSLTLTTETTPILYNRYV